MNSRQASRLLALVLWTCAVPFGRAQTGAASPAPPSRLEQLEATYNELLRGTHQPLLKQYLADLQALQSTALAASESAALQAEITRIQGIIAGKGIIEFEAPRPEPQQAVKVVGKSGILFTLNPADATPVPANATSPDAVVPMGAAAWKLSSLPPGTYDVVAHYACPKPPADAALHVTFAGQSFDRLLTSAQVTKDAKTFRVIRLCQITLKEEAALQSLAVTAAPAGEPWLFLKQVLVVKAKGE